MAATASPELRPSDKKLFLITSSKKEKGPDKSPGPFGLSLPRYWCGAKSRAEFWQAAEATL
jgi:hypothetical protein